MEAVYAALLALNHYWEADKDAIKAQVKRYLPLAGIVLCSLVVVSARQRLASPLTPS